jgi:hypothetical protein
MDEKADYPVTGDFPSRSPRQRFAANVDRAKARDQACHARRISASSRHHYDRSNQALGTKAQVR